MQNLRRFLLHMGFAALAGGLLYAAEHVANLSLDPALTTLFVAVLTAAASFARSRE